MTAALLIVGLWCALDAVIVTVYAYGRHHRRHLLDTYAARVRYSTEALTEARLRAEADALDHMCHQLAAGSLDWHRRAVANGLCTDDCSRALEWQLELQTPQNGQAA